MDIVLGACVTAIGGVLQECAETRRAIVRPFKWCCCCTRQASDCESLDGSQCEDEHPEYIAAGRDGEDEPQRFGVNDYDSQPSHNPLKDGHYRTTPPMKPSYGSIA